MKFTFSRNTLLKITAVTITIGLLAILFSQIQVGDVIRTLAGIKSSYLIAGFLVYSISYLFRALRFQILLNKEIRTHDIFKIVCIHNLVNCILPARTGELSYVYLLKKVHKKATGEGIATLFMARIFDLFAIILLFLFSIFFIQDGSSAIIGTIWVVIAVIIILVALVILIFYSGRDLLNSIKCYSEKLNLVRWSSWRYILAKGEETIDCLEKTLSSGSYVYIQVVLLTSGVWLSLYAVIYLLVIGMGISLGFPETLFASTFTIVSTVLPISGIAGFGTIEGAWTIGFMLVGVPKEEAIISGFSYHLVTIVYFLILGLYGLLIQKIWIHIATNND
jgi:uncharacterized protein (TIRG00374 family)